MKTSILKKVSRLQIIPIFRLCAMQILRFCQVPWMVMVLI